MNKLSREEEIIFNNGERLIPGVTHDLIELIRHRNSYLFFSDVIEKDLLSHSKENVTIVDLGCGVGHGCVTMSRIKSSKVLGVDSSNDSLEYAKKHYAKENIKYSQENLPSFIPTMLEHDYVVSRGVMEHVPDGINLVFSSKWNMRLMFDVPYLEPAGDNPHHVIHNIDEQTFAGVSGVELFYEDFYGNIYSTANKPPNPNLIMCVLSSPDLPRVESFMKFPYYAHMTFDQKIDMVLKSISWNNVVQWLNKTLYLFTKTVKRILRPIRSIWTTERRK